MRAFVLSFAASVSLVAACANAPPSGLTSSAGGTTSGTSGTTTGSSGTPGGTSGSAATGGGTTALDYFNANVLPFLDDGATGAVCAECHSSAYADDFGGPDFLGASPGEFYGSLTGNINYVNADPNSSKFLKIHQTPIQYTGVQYDHVETWLQMEAAERFGGGSGSSGSGGGGTTGGPPPGPTGEELATQFGQCMTLDDWTATGMHLVAAQGTLQDGPCHKCHDSGVGSNYMGNPNSQASVVDGFEMMRTMPFIQRLITWEVDPDSGQVTGLVQSYRWQDKGFDPGGHPKYVMTEVNVLAMETWFALVNEKCFGGMGAGGGGGAGGSM